MKIASYVHCNDLPCLEIRRDNYLIPAIDIDQADVSILLISEATLLDPADTCYAGESAF